jgi:hypothetical protein
MFLDFGKKHIINKLMSSFKISVPTTTNALSIQGYPISDEPENNDTLVFNSASQSFIYDTGIVGPTGPVGPAGSDGPTGPAGGDIQTYPTSRNLYVSKIGSDSTGTGTSVNPFLTISYAIQIALSLADLTAFNNQICISVAAGLYIEDNSVGPIQITKSGINIIGDASRGTMVQPSNVSNVLFSLAGKNINIENIRFQANYTGTISSAKCIDITGTISININNCMFLYFGTAIYISGSGNILSGLLIQQCIFTYNTLAVHVEGVQCVITNSTITGNVGTYPSAQNGVLIAGSTTILYINNCIIAKCVIGLECTNNSYTYSTSNNSLNNTTHILTNTQCDFTGESMTFSKMRSGDICLDITDSGTKGRLIGCFIDGRDYSGVIQGIGVYVHDNGAFYSSSCRLTDLTIAIQCGKNDNTDTSTTIANIDNTSFRDNTMGVWQYGTTTVNLIFSNNRTDLLTFTDTTNIYVTTYNRLNNCLLIGPFIKKEFNIFSVCVHANYLEHPVLKFYPDLYGYECLGYLTSDDDIGTTGSSIGNISTKNSSIICISTILTGESSLKLYSDNSATIGDGTLLRGWTINKTATDATLDFIYQNTNPTGQSTVTTTLLSLDGYNKYAIFNTDTIIKYGSGNDTNLFRDSSGVLKTNASFICNDTTILNQTASRALALDSNKKIVSVNTTSTELGYLNGVTSAIQTQFTGKLSTAGGTLSGNLTCAIGSTSLPSLNFTGSITSGLSCATANTISVDVNANEVATFTSSGLTLKGMTSTGIVHNNSSGLLTSSLIVNADITDATITNAKLSTVSSANTNNYIVSRDNSGNFSTNMITLSGTTTSNTDVATKSYVDSVASTGIIVHEPVVTVAIANSAITGLLTINGVTLIDSDRVLLTGQSTTSQNGIWVAHTTAWTRPTDFNTGDSADEAYVLVTAGTYIGSSWLCSTPNAIIGTDPITFSQFTLAITNSGNNIGVGTGSVYSGVIANVLQFRTLLAGTYNSISTGTNEVTINTLATNLNTVSTIVARDGSGNFSAGTITASLTGASSLNVLKTGDTMSGNLVLPAGNTSSPSLKFTGGTNTGLSMSATDVLSISTNATERMNIGANGQITISNLNSVGTVHSDINGLLTSSLIVNADIDNSAGIVDTKLATISTAGKVSNSATTATNANTASAIVARDVNGNFSAGTITGSLVGSLTGASSLNVLKTGDTMSGSLVLPAGTNSLPSLNFTGSTTSGLSASNNTLSINTNATERINIASNGAVSIKPFILSGIVHNSDNGLLTSSLIVNADIDNSAGIVDTKLATISTAGKVSNSATTATNANTASAIVARDVNGNFSAGTITASLTGASSLNVLKTGDTMSGSLVLPAGTNGLPSLNFTGSTTSGLSASNNTLSINTNATERINIASDGTVSIKPFVTAGIVTNSNTGVLSTTTTLPIANGGTNSSTALTGKQIIVSNTAGTSIGEAGVMTNGQLLIGSTGAQPVIASITAGVGVAITNGAGSITLKSKYKLPLITTSATITASNVTTYATATTIAFLPWDASVLSSYTISLQLGYITSNNRDLIISFGNSAGTVVGTATISAGTATGYQSVVITITQVTNEVLQVRAYKNATAGTNPTFNGLIMDLS